MFEIEFNAIALKDLAAFRRFKQRSIVPGIEAQLVHEPTRVTRHRKRLRPNDVAEWELRIGKFRVFYHVDVERLVVSVEAVGFKIGNLLFIHGEKRFL